MIPVNKAFLPPIDHYIKYLRQIWFNGWLTNNGNVSRELAEKLCSYLKVPHVLLIANGTLALQLAIKSLALKGEIITTPFSYVATTSAILWEGCDPVFVDIEDKSFCIDPELIEDAITEQTSAILATHVYGYPCNIARLDQIACKHNLKVIYDAAHAFGVEIDGQSIAGYGDISALSFHATKLFHTAEGGAVVCKDKALADRIFLLSKFGHLGEDDYFEAGINAKMSELHAAMGLCVLPKVEESIFYRKECSAWYDELLEGCALQRPVRAARIKYNYAYYPVIFSSVSIMAQVRQALIDNNISSRRYFYPSLNTLSFLKPNLKRHCPVSESVSSHVLCLPLYVGLQRKEIEFICNIIRKSILQDSL
jgi:dTDP-4-amino-4,6-dideoxygalactose transaminase